MAAGGQGRPGRDEPADEARTFAPSPIADDPSDGWPESVGADRRRARAVAVQALYEADLTRREPATVIDRRLVDDATPTASAGMARFLVASVSGRRDEIDRALGGGAPQWPVDRIDPVERAILRIAILELLNAHGPTGGEADRQGERVPVRVAINEAVELARLFGTEASVRFVNGVLGAVARRLAPEGAPPPDVDPA